MTIKPYTTVQFGNYSATKNVPIVKSQSATDTFIHTKKDATNYDQSTIDSIFNKYQIIYNPITGKKEYVDLSKIMYD